MKSRHWFWQRWDRGMSVEGAKALRRTIGISRGMHHDVRRISTRPARDAWTPRNALLRLRRFLSRPSHWRFIAGELAWWDVDVEDRQTELGIRQ